MAVRRRLDMSRADWIPTKAELSAGLGARNPLRREYPADCQAFKSDGDRGRRLARRPPIANHAASAEFAWWPQLTDRTGASGTGFELVVEPKLAPMAVAPPHAPMSTALPEETPPTLPAFLYGLPACKTKSAGVEP